MLEENEFAELYRNLVDQHFKPDSQRAATALQGVLRQLPEAAQTDPALRVASGRFEA